MSDNEYTHGRYNMRKDIHKRLQVEAAMRDMGIQELMAEILDQQLPPLPKR